MDTITVILMFAILLFLIGVIKDSAFRLGLTCVMGLCMVGTGIYMLNSGLL